MLVAIDREAKYVIAEETQGAADYYCPSCRDRVYLKKGQIKIAHFSHRKNSLCSTYSEGESLEHLKGKMELFKQIENLNGAVNLEVFIPEIRQRADILFTHNNARIAVEFQCSPISIEEVCARTRGYHSVGIKVLWIAGSKLAITDHLTALQRALVSQDDNNEEYFCHYDIHHSQISYYRFADKSSCQRVCDSEQLIGVLTGQKLRDARVDFKASAIETNKRIKNLSTLESMRRYKNQYYAPFFQLLYENRLSLKTVPDNIHYSLTSEWMIRTLSFEWKLRVLLWLKHLRQGQVVTKRLLRKQIHFFMQAEQVKVYSCPNITPNYYEKPFDEYIQVLVQTKCLLQVIPYKWRVNRTHSFFSKTSEW
ncbi:MAG: hypothetical protein JJU16_06695 [Alkalibacterium sp.]|nr:hypothetical protein [Alkalibacterium sp.]